MHLFGDLFELLKTCLLKTTIKTNINHSETSVGAENPRTYVCQILYEVSTKVPLAQKNELIFDEINFSKMKVYHYR